MDKVKSPVHLLGIFHDCADTTLPKPPLQFWKGALEPEPVYLSLWKCKLSGICRAAVWGYAIKMNPPPKRCRAGFSCERLAVLFSLALSLLLPRWKMLLPLGRKVCIITFSLWEPCIAEKIHVEAAWLFALGFVDEVLAHMNGETFSVSYMISQWAPEWLRRLSTCKARGMKWLSISIKWLWSCKNYAYFTI